LGRRIVKFGRGAAEKATKATKAKIKRCVHCMVAITAARLQVVTSAASGLRCYHVEPARGYRYRHDEFQWWRRRPLTPIEEGHIPPRRARITRDLELRRKIENEIDDILTRATGRIAKRGADLRAGSLHPSPGRPFNS
jgi:hypothetical protein